MSSVANLVSVTSEEVYKKALDETKDLAVLFFWADWNAPCHQMAVVFEQLAKENQGVTFIKVEAEAYPDITEQFPQITSVPVFVFLRNGKQVDFLEGANAPELMSRVQKHSQVASSASASAEKPNTTPKTQDAAAASKQPLVNGVPADVAARLKKLVNAHPVMVFIKGSASEPKCGFSRKLVNLLSENKATFGSFDILTDPVVRENLKIYSNWPTYPQLYIEGNLVGGLDVCTELANEGELQVMLMKYVEKEKASLNKRIEELLNSARVLLFMKGSPEAPKCGFSRKAVDLLNECGFKYSHFDILSDEEIRQGVKEYSNWPTYPQLYVDGKLIGGLDVITEMHSEGDLAPLAKE